MVSSFGTILLANEAFSLLGLGHSGEPLHTPLREFVDGHADEGGSEKPELSWSSGSRTFTASLVSAGVPEDSFLLLVQELEGPPEQDH